ncbi:MAG: rhodanese-like domain-containing protein [Ignavibacteria bacterium]|nr:rhodanese-like domain-containing protein [Ignavibacteria bacterium]
MRKINLILVLFAFYAITACAQEKSPFVSFEDYEKLMAEAKEHRQARLLSIEDFTELAKQENVVILDARSNTMYSSKHVKGAVNLNFSDFTQETLAEIIPSFDTKILIYCNNNFIDDIEYFPTKISMPKIDIKGGGDKGITLALNIPTYLNLYGYGYKNVYELNEILSVNDTRIEFEGTSVK